LGRLVRKAGYFESLFDVLGIAWAGDAILVDFYRSFAGLATLRAKFFIHAVQNGLFSVMFILNVKAFTNHGGVAQVADRLHILHTETTVVFRLLLASFKSVLKTVHFIGDLPALPGDSYW
jgi:hypothetical protein